MQRITPQLMLIPHRQCPDCRDDVRVCLPGRMRAAGPKDVFVGNLAAQITSAPRRQAERRDQPELQVPGAGACERFA